jgi:hypothetical protein
MRIAAIVCSLAVLAVLGIPAVAGAARARGSLEVGDGRGMIVVKGRGPLLGRLDKGSLTIVDLTPNDQWSPRVNGVPRGRVTSFRGKDATFYVPAGRYRITLKGEGINISARGAGTAVLDGDPDPAGETGTYAVGDAEQQPIPDDPRAVQFGPAALLQARRGTP